LFAGIFFGATTLEGLVVLPRIFVIGIVGGGVQSGPLGTAATDRPIVPAPGGYCDGEIGGMIGRGNRSTRRKPAMARPSPELQTPLHRLSHGADQGDR
jgi:hypothetical protein